MTVLEPNGVSLQAPFPWFGGKSRIARLVWTRFRAVQNYVEPFCGSLATLLARPIPFRGTETVNDADGFIPNFWRAVAADPDAVARHADWPVSECDLHARHSWLVGRREEITSRLEGDPEWFDAKVAGWWVWGQCCWIGSGWCSGKGPWQVVDEGGCRRLVHLGNAGQGVNRQLVHLGNAGQGVNRQLVHLGDAGQGVNRQRVHLGDAGRGVNRKRGGNGSTGLLGWMADFSDRLRYVRICCGDWTRVTSPTVTTKNGLTAVFLDPPYSEVSGRCADIYSKDDLAIAHQVAEWATACGDDPLMRIALCGYEGDYEMPDSWECVAWKTKGGYSSQSHQHENLNSRKERVWFSPHCVRSDDMPLFANLSD